MRVYIHLDGGKRKWNAVFRARLLAVTTLDHNFIHVDNDRTKVLYIVAGVSLQAARFLTRGYEECA